MTNEDKIIKIAQGNIGALQVLTCVSSMDFIIDYIYDFGARGPEIWTLYKDWCYEDLETFCRVIILLVEAHQPEAFAHLQAKRDMNDFFEEWDHYDTSA